MAIHVGSTGNDNISVINKIPLPGYNITATTGSVTPSGNFTDPSLTVNALAGNDTINLSTLTKESGITSTILDGGDGNDSLIGSNGLGLIPGSPLSIPLTFPDGKINLTSLGEGTIGSTVYTIWRLHNGTNAAVGATLTPYGPYSPVFTGNLPPNTDTIVLSPVSTGAATHILKTTSGSFTKAANSQDNNYLAFGNDSLLGGNGDDTLSGLGGNDTLDGGAGTDTVLESGNFNFTLTNNSLTGKGNDSLTSIEQANLTGGTGDNNLDASAFTLGSVTLDGAGGNDTLTGGSGNDFLTGGAGLDSLNGGAGTDTVVESGNFNFTLTNSSLTGNGNDSLTSIEQARLTGGTSNNTINASSFTLGSVTLDGGAGNDTLLGGSGNDFLTGGAGNDSLNGGAGTDTVVESGNFSFTLTNTLLTGNGTDSLANIEQAYLTGGASANTLNASGFTAGVVTLDGGAGNDTLTGGTNSDSLLGGLGNDSLLGGNGDDTLAGEDGNDILLGQGGNDSLLGGNGNDTLTGGLGSDNLTGGTGADRFVFTNQTNDTVTDFSVTENDVFALTSSAYPGAPIAGTPAIVGSAAGFMNLSQYIIVGTTAQLNTINFVNNTRFAFSTSQNRLLYDADGNWSAGSQVIAFSNAPGSLTASNFAFI